MLKKEFADALKKLLECLTILIAIPLALVWDKFVIHFGWNFLDICNFVFVPTLVIYSVYSGANVFQSEKKNRAFEYLLSLPLSRWKIILYKIVPRMVFLLLLLVVSVFFSVFNNVWINGFNLIILFLISLFLSILLSSAVFGLLEVALAFCIIYLNAQIINFFLWRPETTSAIVPSFLSYFISGALLLIPLGIAFWITFKNLDVKAIKLQIRPYLFIALPSVLILITFAVLFYKKYLVWAQKL